VNLDTYEIGIYEITYGQYAYVLNWAYQLGELENSVGGPYTGGTVYAHGKLIADTYASSLSSPLVFEDGVFTVQSRAGTGGVLFPMEIHSVTHVSWYGAVAFCNWRSEIDQLNPAYDFTTWTRFSPVRNGYRLPTEAEWERAAAWDGTQHWRFGNSSDTLATNQANYWDNSNDSNPLGLSDYPQTSPVAWYDGVNVSPHTNVPTENSVSPVGCYDMSGNVWEWCEDWFSETYYSESPLSNPTGPATGTYKAQRGGSWATSSDMARTAGRLGNSLPEATSYGYGIRIARTP
jgi:formylglycine-generating enzyme required for sulfatase activity